MEVSKSEWKLFRSKIAVWQEAYMDKLNKEYIELLNGDGNPSHKFWRLYERIKKDKKKPGVCLEMRMQDMVLDLARLINDGVISYADLEGFSEETIEVASTWQHRHRSRIIFSGKIREGVMVNMITEQEAEKKSRKTKGLREYERVDNTSEKAPDDEDFGEVKSIKSGTLECICYNIRPIYD